MRIHNKTFTGGYRFLGFDGQPEPRILSHPLPERIAVALSSGALPAMNARVSPGDTVAAGQILAREDNAVCAAVLAPLSGEVDGATTIATPAGPVKALMIRSDGLREWKALSGASQDWATLDARELEDLLYRSGATALSPQGIPTRFASSALGPDEVTDIVVLEAHDEVFNPSLAAILGEREPEGVPDRSGRAPQGSAEAARGLAILARIMPRARLHLVFGRPLKDAMCCLGRACRELAGAGEAGLEKVELVQASPKYPMHHESVLLPAVLNRTVPYGSTAAAQGVVIIDVQGLLQVFDAVTKGRPAIERIVALAGTGYARPLHVRVRIGTPVGEVVGEYLDRAVEERLVLNSALSGPVLSDPSTPIDHGFRSILALPEEDQEPILPFAQPGFRQDSYSRTFASLLTPFAKSGDTNIHGEHRPCIACGYCENVCPVRILPYLLHRHIQRDLIDENLVRFEIFKCIDCGLCSYVCTSKIPLAEQIRSGKDRLRAEGLEPQAQAAAGRPASRQAPGTPSGAPS
jgi:Na(+)-translocating NADH:ubiquinone oxidoreductase A subunit